MSEGKPKIIPTEEVLEAYRNGFSSYKNGMPLSTCPYASLVLYHAWMSGWHKGNLEFWEEGYARGN